MYVTCSTLCFGQLPLQDALRAIRDLHFAKADLAIHESGPHLRPSEIVADVNKTAQRLRAANLPIAAFHILFKDHDGPIIREQLKAICRLARLLAVPVLTVQAAPAGSDIAAEVQRLTEWHKLADAEGLILTVETRTGTLTGDVNTAVELCQKVPGLGLTLDPSYYHCGPTTPVNYEPLFPYVRHTRLRDSGPKPDQFQLRVGQGEIEYGRVISSLERYHYDRALCVDVRDVPDSPFPVEPEVRKMKYLLESLV